MKKDIIDFLQSKGLFSIWLLIIIIIGEISDYLEYNPPWSFIKFMKFTGYYFSFFAVWMIIELIVKMVNKKGEEDVIY